MGWQNELSSQKTYSQARDSQDEAHHITQGGEHTKLPSCAPAVFARPFPSTNSSLLPSSSFSLSLSFSTLFTSKGDGIIAVHCAATVLVPTYSCHRAFA